MKYQFILFFISYFTIYAQDSELDLLINSIDSSDTEYTTATFKSTRIVTGHSIERMPEGQLDFRISHRFGEFNSGLYNWFGLDEANIHYGFDYGATDWLMIGIGRGTYQKTYDGLIKFSLLKQSKGIKNMPVSLSYFTSLAVNTLKREQPGTLTFENRLTYVHQLLVAREFNEKLSFEINPTYVHRNLVYKKSDPNDLYALGFGGCFKITKQISINAEYYFIVPQSTYFYSIKTYDPLSIGIDIETGGHVFQIHFSNSLAMIEKGFIGETTGNWLDGDIHLGFNISRLFTIY